MQEPVQQLGISYVFIIYFINKLFCHLQSQHQCHQNIPWGEEKILVTEWIRGKLPNMLKSTLGWANGSSHKPYPKHGDTSANNDAHIPVSQGRSQGVFLRIILSSQFPDV